MTTHTPPHKAVSVPAYEGLSWILDDFVNRVAGVTSALLVSRDGLKMAVSGLNPDGADRAAAWVASLHSLARSAAAVSGAQDGGFRQAIIEDNGVLVFVMSADHAVATEPGTESGLVGSVLGILADPDADPGVVGYETSLLVGSVAEHLVTATRSGEHTYGGR